MEVTAGFGFDRALRLAPRAYVWHCLSDVSERRYYGIGFRFLHVYVYAGITFGAS